jgi:hypothetical protein
MKDRVQLILWHAYDSLWVAGHGLRSALCLWILARGKAGTFTFLVRLISNWLFGSSAKSRRRRHLHTSWVSEVQMLEARLLLSAVDPTQIAVTNLMTVDSALEDGRKTATAIVDAYDVGNIVGDLHQLDVQFGQLRYCRMSWAAEDTETKGTYPAVAMFLSSPRWPGKHSLSSAAGGRPEDDSLPLKRAA